MTSAHQGPPLARLLELTAEAVQAVRAGRSLNDALAHCPPEARPGVQALSFAVLRRLGSALVLREALAPRTPPPAVDALLLTALALLWPGPADGGDNGDAGERSPASPNGTSTDNAGTAGTTGITGTTGTTDALTANARTAEARPAYPDHTLVDQAVAAVRQRNPQAAGFVNAVLRRFGRERQAQVTAALRQPLARHNHPLWWAARLQADWPAQAATLLAGANRHPPMTLRVNARRGDGAAYLQQLQAAGQGARLLTDAEVPGLGGMAIVLDRPCAVTLLPGFAAGEVSVQDAAAQRAARLLLGLNPGGHPLRSGARVLDACAAPGGKTAQLLELADIDLLALDSDAQRLQRVDETLRRLGLRAGEGGDIGDGKPAGHAADHPAVGRCTLKAADARDTATWWDGVPFDAILLDAPCTASGIVRRHPDVRWLRRPEDIAALARVQAALLDALWPLLAPGGRLLYATCSLFKAEGQDQIDAFLQRVGPAAAQLDGDSPGHLLPLADNPRHGAGLGTVLQDGFFYALIHKP